MLFSLESLTSWRLELFVCSTNFLPPAPAVKHRKHLTACFFLIAGGLGSTIEYVQSTSNTLPKTNIAPENGWLEDYILLGFGLCSRAMLVLGMVTKFKVLFGVDT